jgi:hypothetical protein
VGFLQVTGLTVAAFDHLYEHFFLPAYLARYEVDGEVEDFDMDCKTLLSLALHYLRTTASQTTLCSIFSVSPEMLVRNLWNAMEILFE